MVFHHIIVRADFVDGEIVPFCFQASRNSPAYRIGRITATRKRPIDGRTEYTCRLAKSDLYATLILDVKGGVFNWSVDMDCDCIAVSRSEKFPEVAIKHANQLRATRVDCADLTAMRGEREVK